jgi:hypothetical protein
MLDILVLEFAKIGLSFNVSKTQWMVVPPMESKRPSNPDLETAIYKSLKTESMTSCLTVGGRPIKLVDKFEYLGVWMTWRWNWEMAWNSCIKRAQFELYKIRKGGLQHSGASLHALLEYVRGKVASHFNYISAVTGAGGCKSSAPWRQCEEVMSDALQTVVDCSIMNGNALKIESGTWDQQTRIFMLLLRFFSKILTAPTYSTIYRVMCLSFHSLSKNQRENPLSADASIDRMHRQPWSQQVVAAAIQFKLTPPRPDRLWTDLLLVHVEGDKLYSNPDTISMSDRSRLSQFSDIAMARKCRLRLIDPETNVAGDFIEGKNCWTVSPSTRFENIFHDWSTELREATFTVLRKLANRYRQGIVSDYIRLQYTKDGGLRRWAKLVSGSFEQPYWRLPNVYLARRLLRARLDMMDNEDVRRRRPSSLQDGKDTRLPRLGREFRACYLCHCIDGVDDIFWPETIEHALIFCPAYSKEREMIRTRLTSIFSSPAAAVVAQGVGLTGAPPSFSEIGDGVGNTSFLFALLLCTGVGPIQAPILQQLQTLHQHGTRRAVAIENHQRRPEVVASAKRCEQQFPLNLPAARLVASWTAALTRNWVNLLRDNGACDVASQTPGYMLVDTVSHFVDDLFAQRRRLLRVDCDYLTRARDPASFVLAGAAANNYFPVTQNTPNVDVFDVCRSRFVDLFCDGT